MLLEERGAWLSSAAASTLSSPFEFCIVFFYFSFVRFVVFGVAVCTRVLVIPQHVHFARVGSAESDIYRAVMTSRAVCSILCRMHCTC